MLFILGTIPIAAHRLILKYLSLICMCKEEIVPSLAHQWFGRDSW